MKKTWIIFLISFSLPLCFISQNAINGIKASLDTTEVSFTNGRAVTNKLIVYNSNDIKKTISVNVSHPESWKLLGDKFISYEIDPLDTIFIPIRVIPLGTVKGGTKYVISCIVRDVDKNMAVASAYFYVKKPKSFNWKISSIPSKQFYLKNNQTEVDLGFKISNRGNDDDEINFKIKSNPLDYIQFLDSNNEEINNEHYFELAQQTDTIIRFKAKIQNDIRNFKYVGINYEDIIDVRKSYSLFANAQTDVLSSLKYTRNGGINMIKLPNKIKINPYSSTSLPLTIEANISNINSRAPLINLLGRGNMLFGESKILTYNTQFFLSTFNQNPLRNSLIQLGYNTPKYDIQAGNLPTPFGFSGRGFSGRYKFNPKITVGAFSTLSPPLSGKNYLTMGLTSIYRPSRITNFNSSFGRAIGLGNNQNRDYTYFTNFSNFQIFPSQRISLQGNIALASNSTTQSNTLIRIGAGYNGAFFNHKLNVGLNAFYSNGNPIFIGNTSAGINSFGSLISYKFNKDWMVTYVTNTNQRGSFGSFSNYNIFSNNILINGKVFGKPFNPSLTYNFITLGANRLYNRSINYGTSQISISKNTKLSGYFILGQKNEIGINSGAPKPFFSTNLRASYRVWVLNLRHSRGSMSISELLFNDETNFQGNITSLSLIHQYQFKNPRLILENNITIRTNNSANRTTSIQMFPQLYYYTKNNYRLMLNPGLFTRFSKSPLETIGGPKRDINISSIISLGIKKSIGIPIPSAKIKYKTVKFNCFLDVNGNHKQDHDEQLVENVVIRMGNEEIITNKDGEAQLINMFCDSNYTMELFVLEDLKGYFPYYKNNYYCNNDSTLAIPFVKGIKVYGEVYIDRDVNQRTFNANFDLNNIRISAFNGLNIYTLTNSKGEFEMYVPYGEYTISMDNAIVGNKFKILNNNIKLDLNEGSESVFISFYLVEKRKKITIKKF